MTNTASILRNDSDTERLSLRLVDHCKDVKGNLWSWETEDGTSVANGPTPEEATHALRIIYAAREWDLRIGEE